MNGSSRLFVFIMLVLAEEIVSVLCLVPIGALIVAYLWLRSHRVKIVIEKKRKQ